MATKLRLQRHGKKGKPFYHLVAADARAKRDGRFIEKLGIYNPNTNPATIDFDFEKALGWIMKGAQPTDTVKALLSYTGVLYKKHLLVGVTKGALTEEQADKKFEAWAKEKEAKIQAKKDGLTASGSATAAAKFEAEKASKEAKAKEIAAKNTPEPTAEEE
jgi:small subunit ribosomal protein S16